MATKPAKSSKLNPAQKAWVTRRKMAKDAEAKKAARKSGRSAKVHAVAKAA